MSINIPNEILEIKDIFERYILIHKLNNESEKLIPYYYLHGDICCNIAFFNIEIYYYENYTSLYIDCNDNPLGYGVFFKKYEHLYEQIYYYNNSIKIIFLNNNLKVLKNIIEEFLTLEYN